jgi:hypothetical protein
VCRWGVGVGVSGGGECKVAKAPHLSSSLWHPSTLKRPTHAHPTPSGPASTGRRPGGTPTLTPYTHPHLPPPPPPPTHPHPPPPTTATTTTHSTTHHPTPQRAAGAAPPHWLTPCMSWGHGLAGLGSIWSVGGGGWGGGGDEGDSGAKASRLIFVAP